MLNLSGIERSTGSLIAGQGEDIFPCLVFRKAKVWELACVAGRQRRGGAGAVHAVT